MNIIEHGSPTKKRVTLDCPKCGCKFSFDTHEARLCYSALSSTQYSVYCPESFCNAFIVFTQETITGAVTINTR